MTDDYNAIQSAIQAINSKGGGIMFFPPGVYKINQYKIIGGLHQNNITNFTYNKCNGLKIIGYNAKIDLKGDFRQTADYVSGGDTYSNSETIVPFYMQECTNFSIEGFEIDGNVDQMTRDWDPEVGYVSETHSYGIVASTCKDYNISNVYVHHMATDGVTLGYAQSADKTHTEKVLADRNAYLYNVRSSNNARQGCTIDQLRGGTFVECIFENTGTQGSYPNHSPSAGVDIEPDSSIPFMDVNTGELNFIRCSFHSNYGPQISCVYPNATDNVFFYDCSIKTESPPNPYDPSNASRLQQGQVGLAIENGVMENCYIDLGPYNFCLSRGQSSKERTTIRNCTIYTKSNGLASAPLVTVCAIPSYVMVEDCRLIGQHTTQLPGWGYALFRKQSTHFQK